jgi:hypothetical protein
VDRRPPNLWFIASWVLLVIVVTAGFLIQARTLNQLRDQQEQIDEQARDLAYVVEIERVTTSNGAIILCQLLLDLTDRAQQESIIGAFSQQKVNCEAPLEELPSPPRSISDGR